MGTDEISNDAPVDASQWTDDEIKTWIDANPWYQTVPIRNGIVTPGTFDSIKRLDDLELPDFTGRSVLDIGCLTGMYSFESERRGATNVVGIDFDPEHIERARTIKSILGSNVEFKHMDLYDVQELGKFDYVFCIAVLHEVPDLITAIERILSVTSFQLYLEIALIRPRIIHRTPLNRLLFQKIPMAWYGENRRSKRFVPTLATVRRIIGNEFVVEDLGKSVRYELLRVTRKSAELAEVK